MQARKPLQSDMETREKPLHYELPIFETIHLFIKSFLFWLIVGFVEFSGYLGTWNATSAKFR